MTVQEWLTVREPAPPEALHRRLTELLVDDASRDASEAPELFLRAAERVVAELLQRDCTSRDSAIDLLAADALVTYAFEAAADQPSELVPRAAEAMRRIAALGTRRAELPMTA